MLKRLIVILIISIVGIVGVLILATGEDFAERILPLFFGLIVLLYISASWYAGYFIATQKPSPILIGFGVTVLIIAFFSGYFIGGKG